MKNFSYSQNAINFLKKETVLLLFILLNFSAYSNPTDENTERKMIPVFLPEKSFFTSFEPSPENNPPEVSKARPTDCSYHLRRNSARVPATASSRNEFGFTVRGDNCQWTPVSNASWITNVAKPNRPDLDDSWYVTYSCEANPTTAERSGTITMAGYTFTVTQEGAACAISLPSTAGEAEPDHGTSNFSVVANGNECTWTATVAKEAAAWLSIDKEGETFHGSGTVYYTCETNPSSTERTGTIKVAEHSYIVTQKGSACSVSPASPTADIPAEAGKGSVEIVVTGTDCQTWQASLSTEAETWLTIEGEKTGNATRTLNYSYTANTSTAPRTATLFVHGSTYKITQAGACSYSLHNSSGRVPATASTPATEGEIMLTVKGTGCVWQAASNVPWITHLTKSTVVTGTSRYVYYSFEANPTAAERSGTITITGVGTGSGLVYTVIQSRGNCSISLPSATGSVPATSGEGSVEVEANGDQCTWTATVDTDAATWLSIPEGQTMAGSKNLTFSHTENTAPTPRTGTITIAGHIFTVTQAEAGTGITGIEPTGGVKFFPNPAKDFVTVDLSSEKIKYLSLKIINRAGQTIYKVDTPPAGSFQIPLNGFVSGLYFILLQGEGKAWVEKLIVK